MLNASVFTSSLLMRFLYVSRLADGVTSATVTQILRHARERNREAGIGGALLFDGECFGQLLEGEPGVVNALAERIISDTRHRSVRVLLRAGDLQHAPTVARWQTGYCEHGQLDAFEAACRQSVQAPMPGFLHILARADLSP